MKMKLKMKNRSHRYDINKPKSRHGNNIVNIKCLNMIILRCIKRINQQLSNI